MRYTKISFEPSIRLEESFVDLDVLWALGEYIKQLSKVVFVVQGWGDAVNMHLC